MNIQKWLIIFDKKNSPARLSFRYDIAVKHDCYEVILVKEQDEYLFDEYREGILKVRKWEGGIYGITEHLSINDFYPEDFRIKHYYRAHTIFYESLGELMWYGWFYKAVARLKNIHRTYSRHLYNRKKIDIRERFSLLQETVDLYFENGARQSVSTTNVMLRVYSDRWLRHPSGTALTQRTRFLLESLAASGDLLKNADGSFTPLPRALATLEEHWKAEARDTRDSNNRIWTLAVSILALTFSFIFSALSLYISLFK